MEHEKTIVDYGSLLNKRVEFNGNIGWVRYQGPLLHKIAENSKINAKAEWLGIEFDHPEIGKHDGSVEGIEYFKCTPGITSGSLVLRNKVSEGVDVICAIINRYFRDNEIEELLKHKDNILEVL